MRWEYLSLEVMPGGLSGFTAFNTVTGRPEDLEDSLTSLGEEGWEMVAAVPGQSEARGSHILYFKRQLSPNASLETGIDD